MDEEDAINEELRKQKIEHHIRKDGLKANYTDEPRKTRNQVQVVKPAKSNVGIPILDQINQAKSVSPISDTDQINQAKKQAAIERKIKRMGLEPNYSTEDRKTRR